MSSQVRERVSRVESRVGRVARMPFGLRPGEIVASALALMFFIVVIVYYFTTLVPARSRLDRLEAELKRATAEIAPTDSTNPQGNSPATSVKDALDSLQAFKSDYLKPLASGRIDLINQINALAKKDGVGLMSGIDMPFQKGAQVSEDANNRRKKSEDVFNVYPHMEMHFTVFGQYKNLRAFLNDLEHIKQFMIIKSAGFLSQAEKGNGGSRGGRGGDGSGLALTIDASAYFQP